MASKSGPAGRQLYRHASWAPGLVTINPPSHMKPGEAEVATNIELSDSNGVVPRKGYSNFASSPDVANPTVGLHSAANFGLTTMICVGGQTISYNQGGTGAFTNLTTTLFIGSTIATTAVFADINQAIYLAVTGGQVGSGATTTISLRKITANLLAPVLSSTTSPLATCVAAFQNALWVANTADPSNPNRLYWSGQTGGSGVDTWPANNFLDISPNDGDNIVALLPHSNQLLVLKERSIWRITGTPPDDASLSAGSLSVVPLPSTDGCVAAQTAKHRNGISYWLSAKGLFSFDGLHFREVTEQIRETFNAEVQAVMSNNSITNSIAFPGVGLWGEWVSNHEYILLLTKTTTGSPLVTAGAYKISTSPEFNIVRWNWADQNTYPCSVAPELHQVNPSVLRFGCTLGGTFSESATSAGDNGTAFTYTYRTGVLPLGPASTLKLTRFCYARLSSQTNTAPTITLRPDLGLVNAVSATATPTASGPTEQTNRLVLPLVARTVQLEVSGSSSAGTSPTTVYEVNIDFTQRTVP